MSFIQGVENQTPNPPAPCPTCGAMVYGAMPFNVQGGAPHECRDEDTISDNHEQIDWLERAVALQRAGDEMNSFIVDYLRNPQRGTEGISLAALHWRSTVSKLNGEVKA